MVAGKRKAWIKWFYRDWRSSARLRMCSFAARGLWADVISLMAEADPFGFLVINGVVPTAKQLAGLLGGSDREIAKLLQELRDADVYSVTGADMPDDVRSLVPEGMPAGVLISRRMVRDAAKEAQDRENGKGGGNPNLKPPDKGSDNGGVNPPSNPQRSEVRDQSSDLEDLETDRVEAVTAPAVAGACEPPGSQAPRGKASADKRGTRIPAGWQPSDETAQFAIGLGLNLRAVVDEFGDYWRGVPGRAGLKLDWDATFRNNCRRAAGMSGPARRPQEVRRGRAEAAAGMIELYQQRDGRYGD